MSRHTITPTTQAWLEAVLSNDETSTDDELVGYFITEGKLSLRDAQAWVAKRDTYLREGVA